MIGDQVWPPKTIRIVNTNYEQDNTSTEIKINRQAETDRDGAGCKDEKELS